MDGVGVLVTLASRASLQRRLPTPSPHRQPAQAAGPGPLFSVNRRGQGPTKVQSFPSPSTQHPTGLSTVCTGLLLYSDCFVSSPGLNSTARRVKPKGPARLLAPMGHPCTPCPWRGIYLWSLDRLERRSQGAPGLHSIPASHTCVAC